MREDVNSKNPRVFHVLEFPDKRRATLEVIEMPTCFLVTAHLPRPGKNRRKEARMLQRWMLRGIEGTRNDPRPNLSRVFIEGEIVYCGVEKENRVFAFVNGSTKEGVWQ